MKGGNGTYVPEPSASWRYDNMYDTIDQALKKDPTLEDINPNDISTPKTFDAKEFFALATNYRAFSGRNGRSNSLKTSRVCGCQGVLDIWYHNSEEIRDEIIKANGMLDRELSRLENQQDRSYTRVPEERGYTAHGSLDLARGSSLILPKGYGTLIMSERKRLRQR